MTIECSQGEHSIVSKAFRFWDLLHDCRSVAALQRWWFRCLSFLQPGQSLREELQSPIPAQDQGRHRRRFVCGAFLQYVSYRTLFPYACVFTVAAMITMSMVHHGDNKPERKKNLLENFDVED